VEVLVPSIWCCGGYSRRGARGGPGRGSGAHGTWIRVGPTGASPPV